MEARSRGFEGIRKKAEGYKCMGMLNMIRE
jgi:hypothetical protein